MRLNYYYNFKNTIRFFINIENLNFSSVDIQKKSWSAPFKFRIRKTEKSFRTLKIPNIYNFKVAYDYYEKKLVELGYDFENFEELDDHKRMSISYELGEFKENSYDEWQLEDYNKLIMYDVLLRFDIKSFYDNIYTHYILKDETADIEIDKPLSHMNNGRTGGIIMGNYISLYMAEFLSKKISIMFQKKIEEENIKCEFSYFSDDFYIFTNKDGIEKVTNIFDSVLENFNLNKNEDKQKIYDYLLYNEQDKIEKYWKTITRKSKNQQYDQSKRIAIGKLQKNNNLSFTNQLIYRLNNLSEFKDKRVFIVNFFKSKFFRDIKYNLTYFNNYNYHQLLYLIREYPEIVLYIDTILDSFDKFQSEEFKNTILKFYENSLNRNFHDEQLYYFYLIKKLSSTNNATSADINRKIIASENHILISYYIKENLFNDEELDVIKTYNDESYWLEYYYLILTDEVLYSDLQNSISKYLIPKKAINPEIIDSYQKFYSINLTEKRNILLEFSEVKNELDEYFRKKHRIKEESNIDKLDNVI
ncbi:MAG: hypothetical protein RR294_06895 [Bacilli bacterium]